MTGAALLLIFIYLDASELSDNNGNHAPTSGSDARKPLSI